MTSVTDHTSLPRRWPAMAAGLWMAWLLALLLCATALGCTIDTLDKESDKSDTDDARRLRRRLQKGLDTLPPERRGDIDVLLPRDVL